MTSYVEEAVFSVRDRATPEIRRINRELQNLERTAKGLSRTRIGFDMSGVDRAISKVRSLSSDIRAMPKTRSVAVKLTGADIVERRVSSLMSKINAIPASRTVNLGVTGGAVPGVPAASSTGGRGSLGVGFDRAISRMADRIVYAVEGAIIRGFEQGATDRDISDTRISLQDLTAGQRGEVQRSIDSLSSEFLTFSRGQIQGVISELIPVVRGEGDALEPLTREVLKLAELQVSLGEDAASAIESAFKFAKAGEQSGKFTDPSGDVDLEKIGSFFDILKRAVIDFGVEIDATLIRTLTKSLRTAKFSLDDRGLLTAILLAEESGSTAGVGINQAIKQLSGERIAKKQRSFAADVGLIELEEVQTGTEGGKPVIEFLPRGTKEEELLRENPVAWVKKYVIPVMREQGFDPNNPTSASQFAGKITSDRTATEALTTFIIRADEIEKTVDRALVKDVSDERIGGVQDKSLLLSFNKARSQLISVMGEVANSMEGVLIPAFELVADAANVVSNFLARSESPAGVAAVAVGGAAVAGGAVVAGKKALSALSPGSSALLKSSAMLDSAAAALLKAAKSLSSGDGGDGKKKKGFLGKAAGVAGALIKRGGGPIAGAALILDADEVAAGEASREAVDALNAENEFLNALGPKVRSAVDDLIDQGVERGNNDIRMAMNAMLDEMIRDYSDTGAQPTLDDIERASNDLAALQSEMPEMGEKAAEAMISRADEFGELMGDAFRRKVEEPVVDRHGRNRRRRGRSRNLGEQDID